MTSMDEGTIAVNWRLLLLVLFSAIGAKALHVLSARLCPWVVKMTLQVPEAIAQLRDEVADLKLELHRISAMDNFADHAKLQRRINQKEAELKKLEAIYKNASRRRKAIVLGVFFVGIEATRIGILVANRYSPIIQLPPEYMWPLASIISFPTAVKGAVGPPLWALFSRQFTETIWITS